jgi:uracil-DNA glycosylase
MDLVFRQLEMKLRAISNGMNHLMLEPKDPVLQAAIERALVCESADSDVLPLSAVPYAHGRTPRSTALASINSQPHTPSVPEGDEKVDSDPSSATNLDSLKLRLLNCTRCPLWETRRTIVFGQGNQRADLVFIGEGPGADEDKSGLAFVGRAGKLLTQIIQSIGISRESVYIANIVKCRPPGNRPPSDDEISACVPFLCKQLELIEPKLIVTLGNVATKTLVPNAEGIMRMRGKLASWNGIPLIPTFHPSHLLRHTWALKPVWNDMRLIRQQLFRS